MFRSIHTAVLIFAFVAKTDGNQQHGICQLLYAITYDAAYIYTIENTLLISA